MSTIRMVAVTPTGEVREVTAYPGDRAVLDALYLEIDCSRVDVVALRDLEMWVDDDGLINNSPFNPFGSYVAVFFGASQPYYCGTVVFSGPADDEGGTTTLYPYMRGRIEGLVANLARKIGLQ